MVCCFSVESEIAPCRVFHPRLHRQPTSTQSSLVTLSTSAKSASSQSRRAKAHLLILISCLADLCLLFFLSLPRSISLRYSLAPPLYSTTPMPSFSRIVRFLEVDRPHGDAGTHSFLTNDDLLPVKPEHRVWYGR